MTDAGLAALAEQLNGSPLGTLVVAGPGVTNAGVFALRKKVRGVQIIGPDGIVPPRSAVPVKPPAEAVFEELPR